MVNIRDAVGPSVITREISVEDAGIPGETGYLSVKARAENWLLSTEDAKNVARYLLHKYSDNGHSGHISLNDGLRAQLAEVVVGDVRWVKIGPGYATPAEAVKLANTILGKPEGMTILSAREVMQRYERPERPANADPYRFGSPEIAAQ
ncbi:MAG: hypothetical protein AB7H77_03290 [Bdellovibrionales bacterium]